jgi:bifunctional enzyme CysN/CysC
MRAIDKGLALLGHKGAVVWMTGLSGAGKTTISTALEERLTDAGILSHVLDGDVLRTGLCSGLGFTEHDRNENIRRAACAAIILAKAGLVSVCSLISPLKSQRDMARRMCEESGVPFIECYVSAPLDECERRDVKGLYARARAGDIPNFTGITAPYEPPDNPEVVLDTQFGLVAECVGELLLNVRRMVQVEV